MRKQLITFCLVTVLILAFILSGCSDKTPTTDINSLLQNNKFKSVEQVGEIPDALKIAVQNNYFNGIAAFDDILLKSEISSIDKENRVVTYKVKMMDLYGNDIATYTCNSDDAYHITTLTATSDGGFLFVLGFENYAYDQNVWASDKGYASRVIKCDKKANVQFDIPFDSIEGSALKYCFEKNEHFYFFGTTETPETKNRGTYSPTDIYMTILDKNGTVLKKQCIAGSDYDNLNMAEISDDCFVLSIRSQSDDGDFINSNSNGYPAEWVFTVNDSIEITDKKKESGRDYFDNKIGEKDGTPIYKSNSLLKDYDAGTPEAFIDYGDFYLIVSENTTGVYEKTPPTISAIWHYTETVYSAYDNEGKLIFRASVDSSPDFDSWIQSHTTQ